MANNNDIISKILFSTVSISRRLSSSNLVQLRIRESSVRVPSYEAPTGGMAILDFDLTAENGSEPNMALQPSDALPMPSKNGWRFMALQLFFYITEYKPVTNQCKLVVDNLRLII